MTTARKSWEARYRDTGEHAANCSGVRYTPAHTYREAQAEATRSGRAVMVAPRGSNAGRVFEPEGTDDG